MAKVFEIRDCDGILWGVFPRRKNAELRLQEILDEHGPDFPRGYYVATGELDDEDFYERFEKPVRRPAPRKPARKKKVAKRRTGTRAKAASVVDSTV